MTEVKCTVVGLYNKGYLKFHIQYMGETLVLRKKPDVPIVLQTLNDFYKNINFTVHTFEDKTVHFLDLLIEKNTTDIFNKEIRTDQYPNYNSLMPWNLKTPWIKSLCSRASKICSSK